MKNELENLLEKYFNIIVNHNNFDVKMIILIMN